MRRSTYLVTLPDGHEQTLDRDAIVAGIDAGAITGDARVSVAGSRPRRLAEHPAFRKLFPDAKPELPERSATRAGDSVRPRASAPSSSTPRSPRPRTPGDPPVALGASGPVDPISTVRQPEGRPEIPVSSSAATPLPENILQRDAVDIRDLLWAATPEQVVGCRVEAGRAVGLRSAGLRLRQLKARADEATSASDRLRLDECMRIVDAAMRIVTQPGKWRDWQVGVAASGGDLCVGAHAKIPRGDIRASGGRRSVAPPGARREKRRRLVAAGPDVLGKEMLAAAGVEGFEAREIEESGIKRTVPSARAPDADAGDEPEKRAEGALDVPDWLLAPAHTRGDGDALKGPLVWGVGTRAAGMRALGIVAAAGLIGGALIALGAPGGAEELAPAGAPIAALLRMALGLLVCAALFQSVRKEGFERVGWPVDPQDALISAAAAVPGMLLFAALLPVPVPEEGAAMLPVALLLRAVTEWALIDAALTRTLLVEWKETPAAIAAGALMTAAAAGTYAAQWGVDGSALAPIVWGLAVGVPAAWSVYRAGSALPALLVRVVVVVGGSVLGIALG